jgi:hypothetical protein
VRRSVQDMPSIERQQAAYEGATADCEKLLSLAAADGLLRYSSAYV